MKSGVEKSEPFVLIPVPLYPARERERGFNQAEIIARIIFSVLREKSGLGAGGNQAGHAGRFILEKNILARVRPTAQQAHLARDGRMKNVSGVFSCRGPASETVILVDDVFTSGATAQECAKVLKSAGAKKVFCLTLARAV